MKKIIFIFFIFIININFVNAVELDVYAESYILYNFDSNKIVLEKNSNNNVKIASLTKIMAVLVALDEIDDLQKTVTITSNMLNGLNDADASTAGFKIGDILTYEDLLYGALLPSGADATRAIAISLYGSEDAFAKIMNKKAKSIKMIDTNFTNSSGLNDELQKATTADLLKMMLYALDNPTFKKIFESNIYITSTGLILEKTLIKSMELYNIEANYITGGKTGFTTPAGLCLISTARNEESYLLITTGSRNDKIKRPLHILDAKTIYDYYFENYEYKEILSNDALITKLPVKYSKVKNLDFNSKESINLLLSKTDNISFEYVGIKELSYKNKVGDKIGVYKIFVNEKLYDSIDVILDEQISFSLINFLNSNYYLYICGAVIISGIITLKIKNNLTFSNI